MLTTRTARTAYYCQRVLLPSAHDGRTVVSYRIRSIVFHLSFTNILLTSCRTSRSVRARPCRIRGSQCAAWRVARSFLHSCAGTYAEESVSNSFPSLSSCQTNILLTGWQNSPIARSRPRQAFALHRTWPRTYKEGSLFYSCAGPHAEGFVSNRSLSVVSNSLPTEHPPDRLTKVTERSLSSATGFRVAPHGQRI